MLDHARPENFFFFRILHLNLNYLSSFDSTPSPTLGPPPPPPPPTTLNSLFCPGFDSLTWFRQRVAHTRSRVFSPLKADIQILNVLLHPKLAIVSKKLITSPMQEFKSHRANNLILLRWKIVDNFQLYLLLLNAKGFSIKSELI